MNDLIKIMLKSLGAGDTAIAELETVLADEEKAKSYDVKKVIGNIVNHQRTLLENDSDFIGKFQSAEKGKIMEQVDRRLKQVFGVTPEELKDKTIEEKVLLSKAKIEANYSKTGNEMQNENITLKNRIKELEEVEIPKVKGEVDIFKKNVKIDNEINKIVGSQKLRVAADAIIPAVKSILEANYHVDLSDDGLQILTKDTKLQIKNADGTAILTPVDIITGKLKEFKAIEESNADDDEKEKRTIIVSKEKPDVISAVGLNAAEQHLASVQKNLVKK